MSLLNDVSGTAALAICESLLLALNDGGVLPEKDIVDVLRDAVTTLNDVPGDEATVALNAAAAKVIVGMIDGGNSVRRQ
ncbi:hypothetical protein SAMN05421759_11482 [Roseivivax lentus]|uniref:Uncharacterized protein n=1 Tax=Roseivivax lentus TaxID=633194 RepID=A0A1N7PD47_9RHOB|nr:hypothetical protein [Roseivivax lentus]SIT08447.1 hypothetical protein SAMN05421759_11482 [Roseivivax lentus]